MAHVKILQADGDKAYGDQNTDGSNSIRSIYEDMRRAGGTARMMLVSAAAARWKASHMVAGLSDAVFMVVTVGTRAASTDGYRKTVPPTRTLA